MKDKKVKTMLEVTKGYEKFIANKETNKKGAQIFNKILKKATKIKQRG